ncbi:nucleotidyltransferase domain-containing protein [Chthonomonas calidirosea]|uniref:nucleotidyltransferase domain-containing protein n=1 Tax=Chthonomonas calidirosea TaxID=454171 RepID=UPI0006ECBF53|nr:nucleotidyltransferase [Chthonomonas calidirosea]CEK15356.1 tRNA nucleotidyltransferase (CCA-adding enzyme) [Chthonomonas calidirosea]
MPIPESQLEIWSRKGADTTAKRTHESIRKALQQCERLKSKDFEVYLQGSYKNDTNIRGNSDVDIVVQLNSTFRDNLSEEQKGGFSSTDATYGWNEFRSDVLMALRDYYAEPLCYRLLGLLLDGRFRDWDKVRERRKCLKVQTQYLPADAVVCIQYRKYPPSPRDTDKYTEGMTFYVQSENRWVINYPKLHYENGVRKNKNTNGLYKPTIRLFKNARTYLRGNIAADIAPSYFLECLLYNVPDDKFGESLQKTFCNVVNWLYHWLSQANLSQFVCQNEQLPLFGNSPEQWSEDKARQFVREMIDLWKNWS